MYKDAETCRPVYDMSTLGHSGLFTPPPFALPCIRNVLAEAPAGAFAIKLDLCNGFYHLPVSPGGRWFFGIKCENSYFRFKKLPMGWAGSPFLMQSCMSNVFNRIGENFKVLVYTYLDDILLIGGYWQLKNALPYLLKSDLLINFKKSYNTL